MTSEMQRDIERIEPLIPFDPETREAWQRIRQRLSPDRERVARKLAVRFEGDESAWPQWVEVTDAAIAAMGEP